MAIMRSRRTVHSTGVLYEVAESEIVLWTKFIPFGKNEANRAGGSAFVEAAREQEQRLREVLDARTKGGKP